jgi:cell division septum initiation protein DivIVA
MPDQSSAATEHAIIQEITAPLEALPEDPLAVVNADFPAALRGYDRMAVDAYVQQTAQLVAELQATRSPEAAVRRALERVGEQISGILQRAHDTAEQITAQSRREAEDRLEKARVEAAEVAAAAQRRVNDLDTDTDRIWIERHRIVDDARDLAQQLLALAETAAQRFPPAETTPFDDEAPATEASIAADEPAPAVRDAPVFEDDGAIAEAAGEEVVAAPRVAPESAEETADNPAAEEDVEATVAFSPLDMGGIYEEPDDAADPPETAEQQTPPEPKTPPRRSNSVIPPASQAANRKSSK